MTLKANRKTWTNAALAVSLLLGATAAQAQWAGGPAQGVDLPGNVNIYALTSDNAIYVLKPNQPAYQRLGRVNLPDAGNLIGIDFRPADNTPTKVYGYSDVGNIYVIDVSSANFGQTTLVSKSSPRLTAGLQSLFDFNPVLNAIRLAGSNDQNIAVVNDANGGNLTQTVAQTPFAYAQGDVNFGKSPELVGGAYTNNNPGAVNTIFYVVDHDLDTLVTIKDKNATGSSNTGGGQLQTIGSFVDEQGKPLNMSPTTDFDIYTDPQGNNFLVGQTTRLLFSIDLAQINPNLPIGQTQRIVVKRGQPAALPGSTAPLTGGVFDIAITARP